MECLVGSMGGVHLDAEPGFILIKTFSSMFLGGSKAAKSFFFFFFLHHTESINTTLSTGEHNVALYIGTLTIEIKYVPPGPCSWI